MYTNSDYAHYFEGRLEKLSTRHLFAMFRRSGFPSSEEHYKEILERGYPDTVGDYRKKLKEILATREHIPNKQEAKKIRQKKFSKK